MNQILRIIITLVNLIFSYFLAREVVEDLTVNKYILVALIVVITLIISIFTSGGVKIEINRKKKNQQQSNEYK
jgi:hypothetical protein